MYILGNKIESLLYLIRNSCYIFCLICFSICAQEVDMNQLRVDSLKKEYNNTNSIKSQIYILSTIAQDETNPDEKLIYSELLIEATNNEFQEKYFFNDSVPNFRSILHYKTLGYLEKGNALQLKGEYHESLENYFICMELAEEGDFTTTSSSLLVSIADTYSMIGNSESAKKYYDKAIDVFRKSNDTIELANALLNAGDEYYRNGEYNKALNNFKESEELFHLYNYPLGTAYNKGNIGMVYAKLGDDDLALTFMDEAINILENIEDYYAISEFLIYISDIYQEREEFDTAVDYASKALELATKYELKDQISAANLQLSELMQNSGNYKEALERYIQHDIYQDSILNLENVQKMANLEVDKKEAEKNEEIQKRKNQRIILWSTVGILLLIAFLAVNLFKQNKFVKKTNEVIAAEKERSDSLLLNILPEDTAQELKDKGRVAAKKYDSVTVFFSDFKGFTKYAENLSPEILVETIDHYFSKFDMIIEKYGLEKIKTIGDAYMAAGGLNYEDKDHAKKMILAAEEMVDFVAKAKHDENTDGTFDIRIGINTGPVVAGVVGTKKFAYDIWGDTVNIAARMESSSEPGRINISEDTYQCIKDHFNCEFRGKLAVKNRGELNMYFVNS